MATFPRTRTPTPQRLVLTGVSWQEYGKFLRAFAGRRAVRLTYDRGVLEIMSPLHEHETDVDFLGQLAVALTEEMGLTRKAGGSTTLRRRKRRRGLEPDRCYWIASEPLVRGKRDINLHKDPPPDLAIEVDITRSSLDRLTLYGALGVPEVWRYDGEVLRVYHRREGGTYEEAPDSLAFPFLPVQELVRFVEQGQQSDDTAVARAFQEWVRLQILPRVSGGEQRQP